MVAAKDMLLNTLRDNTPGGVSVTENSFDNKKQAYFKYTYNRDGQSRFVCGIVKAWRSLRDDSCWFYAIILDCPIEQTDDYMELMRRIRDGVADS
jgi:hypothetical protein